MHVKGVTFLIKNWLYKEQLKKCYAHTPKGQNLCKDCHKFIETDELDSGHWICPPCRELREKRIKEHIKRIRKNPLWKGNDQSDD